MSGVPVGRYRSGFLERSIILELEALDLTILLADGVKDLALVGGRGAGFHPGGGDKARVGLDDVQGF